MPVSGKRVLQQAPGQSDPRQKQLTRQSDGFSHTSSELRCLRMAIWTQMFTLVSSSHLHAESSFSEPDT